MKHLIAETFLQGLSQHYPESFITAILLVVSGFSFGLV